jgi:predicted alpha/beta-hydrolase family hydrolase
MKAMVTSIEIDTGRARERVSAEFLDTANCTTVLVFAHGAGAGMQHEFMTKMSHALIDEGIATLRFQFPYMEKGRRAPDRQNVLTFSVAGAAKAAAELCAGRPLFVGGKSMGGRMASIAAADGLLEHARGLIFFGFPLHVAGKPSQKRAAHLTGVDLPILFLQGTRDRLADMSETESVCRVLANRVTLEKIEGADHSFGFLKSAGRDAGAVYPEIAAIVRHWCQAQRSSVTT